MVTRKKKETAVSSDRQKWQKIYSALIQTIRQQEAQLGSLLEQRKLLEQRIKIQYDRWVSDVHLLEDEISQMKRKMSLDELARIVEAAKADLVAGSKQKDAFVYKSKLEHAESELRDFKSWFDILSHGCLDQENVSPGKLYENLKAKVGKDSSSKESSQSRRQTLENEVSMLKREYEKLSLKNISEVSALKTELDFVWNQYKEMESNYTSQLQTKNDEINQTNKKIVKLLASIEQLQSSNTEKDDVASTLRANIAKLEAEVNQKDGEIARLSKDLEFLRSDSTVRIPVLNHCSRKTSSSSPKEERKGRNRGSAALEEEVSSGQQEGTVLTRRAKITKLEAEAKQKNGEIYTLSKELELLRSKSTAETPVLKHCNNGPSSARSRARGNGISRGSASLKEEASTAVMELSDKPSKRERDDDVSLETPRLFTSQFKIPKLKSQSPRPRW